MCVDFGPNFDLERGENNIRLNFGYNFGLEEVGNKIGLNFGSKFNLERGKEHESDFRG